MRSFLGYFPFFMAQATCALIFFYPYGRVVLLVHNRHLVLRKRKEKKYPPKLGIICERYWIFNLAPTFGQLMGTASQNKQCQVANLRKLFTCLEYEVLIHYFGPHASGNHPTQVDTSHPRRLPPCPPQTLKILGGDPLRVA